MGDLFVNLARRNQSLRAASARAARRPRAQRARPRRARRAVQARPHGHPHAPQRGEPPRALGRRAAAPVAAADRACIDVVRAAAAEIADFPRVELVGIDDDLAVSGRAVVRRRPPPRRAARERDVVLAARHRGRGVGRGVRHRLRRSRSPTRASACRPSASPRPTRCSPSRPSSASRSRGPSASTWSASLAARHGISVELRPGAPDRARRARGPAHRHPRAAAVSAPAAPARRRRPTPSTRPTSTTSGEADRSVRVAWCRARPTSRRWRSGAGRVWPTPPPRRPCPVEPDGPGRRDPDTQPRTTPPHATTPARPAPPVDPRHRSTARRRPDAPAGAADGRAPAVDAPRTTSPTSETLRPSTTPPFDVPHVDRCRRTTRPPVVDAPRRAAPAARCRRGRRSTSLRRCPPACPAST